MRVLQIGLTGGIGAGKSSVAQLFAEHGAGVIDSDRLARDMVAPGTPGLAAVVAEFGTEIAPDGILDRAALGQIVFTDDDARTRLNAIVHPLVRAVADARVSEHSGGIVVHDVPLLIENGLTAEYHLVVVVGAPSQVRLDRLVRDRGMEPDQGRARMAAQASDEQRRVVADEWIENSESPVLTAQQVQQVWSQRIAPYAQNLCTGRRAARPVSTAVVTDPGAPRSWAVQAEAVLRRLRRAGGPEVCGAHHIGSTAVPGLVAKDVLDLQLGVADLAAADRLADTFAEAGFPREVALRWWDNPKPDLGQNRAVWEKRFHVNADPGRPVNLHVRVAGGPGWRYALMFRDWLRAEKEARDEYATLKRTLAQETPSIAAYADAKEWWFQASWPRIQAWAEATDWQPPPSEA